METFSQDESDQEFERFWQAARKEIIRIETLQDYGGEDDSPSLSAWLGGDKDKSLRLLEQMAREGQSEWIGRCQDKVSAGVNLKRYHVVRHPYSDYLEWEIAHYNRINIPLCKEAVFLVDANKLQRVIKSKPVDIMLIDDCLVIENKYDQTGRMINQIFYDRKNDNITNFLELKDNCQSLGRSLS